MDARSFLKQFAACSILLAAAYVSTFFVLRPAPVAAEHWLRGTSIVKRQLAEQVEGSKILFVGGSSTLFGVEAASVAEQLRVPAINLGLHAGLPLAYHLEYARQLARTGDTVVLFPEYGYFRETQPYTSWFIDQVIGWDELFFRSASFPETMRFIAGTPAKSVVNMTVAKLLSRRIHQLHPGRRPATAQSAWLVFQAGLPSTDEIGDRRIFQYYHNNLNRHGDIRNTVGSDSVTPQDYGLLVPVGIEQTFVDQVKQFEDDCERIGCNLVVGLAPVMDAGPIADHREDVIANLEGLMERLRQSGFSVLQAPLPIYPPEMFFDTNFHLNIEGKATRSRQIADALQPLTASR